MTTITRANVIGKSQNRTALGMINAYLKMYPNTTVHELRAKFSKKSVCPDAGIADIFYTPNEIEQEIKNKADWFVNGNALFTADDEWLILNNGQKIAFNKMWTAKSLTLLQQAMAKYHIYGEVGSVPKGMPAGFIVNYQYADKAEQPQGLPSLIWLVLGVVLLVAVGYVAYTAFT